MLHFIVNPNAGGGRCYKYWRRIEHYLRRFKTDYKVYISDGPGNASEIAAKLTEEETDEDVVIIAVGGDGTVNEVLEGVHISSRLILGYIPAGTGNDLAKGLGLKGGYIRCLRRVLRPRQIKEIDYGIISYGEHEHRRFIVSSGLGFDASVCRALAAFRNSRPAIGALSRKLGYILVGLKEIFANKPVKGYIIVDGMKKVEFNHIFFAASHIHPFSGGGFRFAPKADNADGELSVCLMHHSSKLKLIKMLLSARLGNHLKYPGVRSYECRQFKIHTEIPLALHTDGEFCGMHQDVEFCCIERRLRFIC